MGVGILDDVAKKASIRLRFTGRSPELSICVFQVVVLVHSLG
jgi:hypothetical protein